MSNNRMYGGSRYEPQGRNANLAGTMFKRAPIFTHMQSEKQIDSSPFSNYKTNQSFSSDVTQESISPEAIRILLKEELAKMPVPEDNNRKLIHTLQAQITDLKERICEYEKENNTKLHEASIAIKEQMKEEAERMDKEVEQEITSKLRSFFQKVNYELKKDILKIVEDQFLTINYGEDLENRLDDINLRIDATNSLINSNPIPSTDLEHKIQQATLVDGLEPKLAKIQKQIESNRKASLQVASKVKGIEEWVEQESNKTGERELNDKIELLRERTKNIDLDINKKISGFQLQISNSEGDISIVKDKISQLQKYNEEQRSLFLDFNKKLSSSNRHSVGSESNEDLSSSIIVDSLTLPGKGQKAGTDEAEDPMRIKIKGPKEEVKRSVYQFDTENYLMDGEGNYILTDDEKPIKLTQQQIQALFQSNAIEVE